MMNMSCSGNGDTLPVQPYVYEDVQSAAGRRANGSHPVVPGIHLPKWTGPGPSEEEIRNRERRAWELGAQEGEKRARAETELELKQQWNSISEAIKNFDHEREQYYSRIEGEVVRLALAIAGKILHREAQVDPMLIAGLVHASLGKFISATRVKVRVNSDQAETLRKYFEASSDLATMPEIVGDPSLDTEQCLIETELGITDLSLDTQLKEIEHGLFDLMAQRPRNGS